MKLYHHTSIGRAHPYNIIQFEEELNDYVWQRIYWHLVTRDIDMSVDGGGRIFVTLHYTDLPFPSVTKFIPLVNSLRG